MFEHISRFRTPHMVDVSKPIKNLLINRLLVHRLFIFYCPASESQDVSSFPGFLDSTKTSKDVFAVSSRQMRWLIPYVIGQWRSLSFTDPLAVIKSSWS